MMESHPAPIATRLLKLDNDPPRTAIVSIHAPEQLSADEWRCAFGLTGLDDDQLKYAHGSDAIQALVLAIEGLRVALVKMTGLSWSGGEAGDPGIPRFVPDIFGLTFRRRLEQMIEREVDKSARQAIRRGRRRMR